MKKELLSILVGGLIVLTVVSTCFTAGAALGSHRIEKYRSIPLQKIGMGTIKGTVTNQNGNPVSFVRVAAFGNKSEGGREFGFAITHLLINGKGTYEMQVEPGRYLFVRAARLPLYIGAWAGPVYVNDGETVTLDLSITYIGPKVTPVPSPVPQSTVTRNVYTISAFQSHTTRMSQLQNLFSLFLLRIGLE
ncbi:MAG: carboxypeptidase regulatory-like domain-containing protein [Thermoplasmatales archaeon]|nr:carboxypeptidase regulatory-like domain-containing protein [Thermoplasmatales archaeon]